MRLSNKTKIAVVIIFLAVLSYNIWAVTQRLQAKGSAAPYIVLIALILSIPIIYAVVAFFSKRYAKFGAAASKFVLPESAWVVLPELGIDQQMLVSRTNSLELGKVVNGEFVADKTWDRSVVTIRKEKLHPNTTRSFEGIQIIQGEKADGFLLYNPHTGLMSRPLQGSALDAAIATITLS